MDRDRVLLPPHHPQRLSMDAPRIHLQLGSRRGSLWGFRICDPRKREGGDSGQCAYSAVLRGAVDGSLHSGVMYAPVIPPSTRNDVPVMNEDSSLARNSAAFAISSARAKRPIGMWTNRRLRRAGSARSAARSGVSTGPGQRELARMFWRANSTAISRVIASTPPLLAV